MRLDEFTYFRGRVALAAILRALGVGRGDKVAIQAFTCVAVPEAVLAVGAAPAYVDVASDSFTMDPVGLSATLREGARAVVVQHTFGIPADLPPLLAAAREHDVPVVEDCAHTLASTYDGRAVGSFGAAAFYSYEASKPVFVGIGGSARISQPELRRAVEADYAGLVAAGPLTQVQLLAMLAAHRIAYRPSTYWTVRAIFRAVVRLGLIKGNYNAVGDARGPSDDFGRRMGLAQRWLLRRALQRLEAQSVHRRWVANEYRSHVKAAHVVHPEPRTGANPVYGRYPLRTPRKTDVLRLAPRMRVELADFYATPVHPLEGPALESVAYRLGSCPRAEALSLQVVSLPTAPQVDRRQIDRAAALFAGA